MEIVDLIPQKPPMVMVGGLLSSEEKKTVTTFTIQKDNIFCENGLLSEAGLLENIAQSAALRAGYHFSLQSANTDTPAEPPVGFIGGIRDFKKYLTPKVGDTIKTEIAVLHEFGDVSVIYGKIHCGDELVAECEMKIFLKREQ